MTDKIPDILTTISGFMPGVTVLELWQGLRSTLNTPERIDQFTQAAQSFVDQNRSKLSNADLAYGAMNAAGQAILGNDRPVDPRSQTPAEDLLQMALNSGILVRSGHR